MNRIFLSSFASAFALIASSSYPAQAAPVIPDLPEVDIAAIIPQSAVAEIVKTLGILTKHRPYQGGAPLGSGFDFGIEASLVHMPESFGPTLSDLGMGDVSGLENGSLPMTKIHLHKGMGPKADLGISGIYYPGNFVWGLDLKFVLVQPEEGPLWAFRIGYSETRLDLSKFGLSGLPITVNSIELGQGNLKMATRTITPELLLSKRLEFAEPYMGAGVEFTSGQIEVPVTLNILDEEQVLRSGATRSTQFTLFSGISLRLPHIGIRLALEGAYGSLGMHRLGAVVGFGI